MSGYAESGPKFLNAPPYEKYLIIHHFAVLGPDCKIHACCRATQSFELLNFADTVLQIYSILKRFPQEKNYNSSMLSVMINILQSKMLESFPFIMIS